MAFLSNQFRRSICFSVALVLAFIPLFTKATSASPAPLASIASFNGHTIDLTQSWQGARACLVTSETQTECFPSSSDLSVALKNVSPALAMPDVTCGAGGLYLYQNEGFGGNELVISSPIGIWINLDNYGFGNEVSSWINDFSCNAYAAKSTDGTGSHLTMAAYTTNSWIGSAWNDSINSVEIG